MGYSSCCCECVCPKFTEDGQLCGDCLSGIHLGPIDMGYVDYYDDPERDPDRNDFEDGAREED